METDQKDNKEEERRKSGRVLREQKGRQRWTELFFLHGEKGGKTRTDESEVCRSFCLHSREKEREGTEERRQAEKKEKERLLHPEWSFWLEVFRIQMQISQVRKEAPEVGRGRMREKGRYTSISFLRKPALLFLPLFFTFFPLLLRKRQQERPRERSMEERLLD